MNAPTINTRFDVPLAVYGDTSVEITETFKTAFRHHPLGVAVVTAQCGEERVAITVSSLSSVSADPPILMFSASAQSSSTPVLDRAETVVVHMVSAEQLWIAELGATSGIDRFADTSTWERLPTGEPTFHAADVRIHGRVVHRLALGGSVVYAVHALNILVAPDREHGETDPLVYHNRSWHRLSDGSVIR